MLLLVLLYSLFIGATDVTPSYRSRGEALNLDVYVCNVKSFLPTMTVPTLALIYRPRKESPI